MAIKHEPKVKEIRPYGIKELCTIYGVSSKTFRKWLDEYKNEIGERKGNLYNVAQVTIIFEKLGIPGTIQQGK